VRNQSLVRLQAAIWIWSGLVMGGGYTKCLMGLSSMFFVVGLWTGKAASRGLIPKERRHSSMDFVSCC